MALRLMVLSVVCAMGACKRSSQTPPNAAPRGVERLVYSLVDNRLAAHLSREGGLLLRGGSAGFAKYTRFSNQLEQVARKSWEFGTADGAVKVARMSGKTASVFVPLTAQQAKTGIIRVRLKAPADGPLSLRINGNDKRELHGRVTRAWKTVGWSTAGLLVPGENTLQFFTSAPATSVAWIQVGGERAVGDDGAKPFYDAARKALALPEGAGMSYFVMVPVSGRLTGDLSDGRCRVHASAVAEDGATAKGVLGGVGSAVDLSAVGGKPVRLDLHAVGCKRALLSNAALVVPGQVPVVERGPPPKFVLFLLLDSLRADRVRAFAPGARPQSPHFDALAASSSLFMNHYVQGSESQVSIASMWTSLYLSKHRSMRFPDKLRDEWTTIDEVAKKNGKFVAGASANGYIRPERGFGSGWAQYINHIKEGLGLRGEELVEKGLSFIQPKRSEPWFLYLHLIDTHVPWRAKSPWIERYDAGYKGRFASEFGEGPNGFPTDLSEREKDHVRAIYDSNVSYQDEQLGRLIEKLKEWGVYDQTMLIITADHGDELWEDGKTVGHASTLRQTIVHVPMLIHYPPLFPAVKIYAGTEGVDIVPTLADVLGVQPDPEWQGASLLPIAKGVSAYPLLAVASHYDFYHAGRIGPWKLTLAGNENPTLHHLGVDPGEKNNLWGTPQALIGARLLLDPMWMLRHWNVEWKKSRWGNAAAVSDAFAADLGE